MDKMVMETLKVNYCAIVEELNRRARKIYDAPDRDTRKAWERRWKDSELQLRGFENALKCMGIRVIRAFEDCSFYAQITNFEFIEF